MFFNLAWRNSKRNRSENLIYFLTMVTAVATFYIVLSLGSQDVMRFLEEIESDAVNRLLTMLMPTVYLFSLLFVFFLVIFANKYQLECRSRELGLCALLALQFLTQMRETKARYATLSILGARREQMKRSINQQVLWYFLLPLFPACISGTVGICAMQHYLYSNMAKLQQSYPMLLVMALVVVCMLALYGVAIARTANREISKLNWKPNA